MAQLHDRLPERETRAAQHNPEGRESQRHEEGQRDRRVRLREGGPQDHEDEDQPDVVGFPYRPDGMLDRGARMRTSLRPAGGQVPESGAEVGTAEDRVRDNGQQQHYGDGRAHPTVSSAFADSSVEASSARSDRTGCLGR